MAVGFIDAYHDNIGLAFSIVGLALTIPSVFLFKNSFRFFEHVQLVFLYSLVLSPKTNVFGAFLDESWTKFIPNFLNFCGTGQIVCQLGYALSFTICLIGAVIIIWLIVAFQKCRKPNLKFQPIYSAFKGLFRWTYLPLSYVSLLYFIRAVYTGASTNLLPSVIILAFTVVFPFAQLIFYKTIQQQKDQIWIKWFQFLEYARHFTIALIFALGQIIQKDTAIAKYFVYGPLVIYAALRLWKGIYLYKVLERVFFGLGEAIAITIFSLFLFDVSDLMQYQLDFIGLAAILFLDLLLLTIRLIGWLIYGKINLDKINPEEFQSSGIRKSRDQKMDIINVSNDFAIKKKNKFQDSGDQLQNSREDLISSVRKGNDRRRR